MSESIIDWYNNLNEQQPSPEVVMLEKFSDPQGKAWVVGDDGIKRLDGQFFSASAVGVVNSGQEVSSYELPMIIENGEGVLLNITKEIGHDTHFLLQFKPQIGENQVTTTIQASRGNLDNNNVLFSNILDSDIFYSGKVEDSIVSVPDPGKFYKKRNVYVERRLRFSDVSVSRYIPEDHQKRFRWTTKEELMELQCKNPEAVSEFIRLWCFNFLNF